METNVVFYSFNDKIAAQRVEDRVESIPYNVIAAFDPGV
jgi:hypothetical protein